MRALITRGGIPVFVSNEEYDVVNKVDGKLYKSKLNEREAEIARYLTSKGVLRRHKDNRNRIYYVRNVNDNLFNDQGEV